MYNITGNMDIIGNMDFFEKRRVAHDKGAEELFREIELKILF